MITHSDEPLPGKAQWPANSGCRHAMAIDATLARPGKQVVSVSGDGGFPFSAIERGRVRVPTLQKALTEDGVSILDVTVDYSRSVDLAATLVEDRSYEHRPGSASSSVRRSGR